MVESSRDNSLIACPTSPALGLDLPQVDPSLLRRGFCFLKNRGKEGKAEKRERRKNGKGGKTGKAEKRERRKKRETEGKAKKASARFLSKYGARPGGGGFVHCDACMLGCGTKNFKNGVLKF